MYDKQPKQLNYFSAVYCMKTPFKDWPHLLLIHTTS